MKNEEKKLNDELAENEPPVTANSLLAEIEPLLKDYFVGEVSLSDGGITYCLPNGQKFLIKAEEIK